MSYVRELMGSSSEYLKLLVDEVKLLSSFVVDDQKALREVFIVNGVVTVSAQREALKD